MAFSNYSNLFKCGLLSEGSSPSYASDPWATEYCGLRRGSLPFMDALSEISDISSHPPPPPSSSGHDTSDSFTSDGSFYFTFKKKRNAVEHRSFLSLDLAEAQSLPVNLKGKEKELAPTEKLQQPKSAIFSPTFDHSFMHVFSPPPSQSSPGSPISAHSVPDPCRSTVAEPIDEPVASGSQSPTSVLHSPSPRRSHLAFPIDPPHSKRELSPMRFADPSPPPFELASHFDSYSSKSIMSAEVLSRSSTISSGYRRAQRGDALKRLEGRGADGAVGRLKPRLSQNFMQLSDDEDEDSLGPATKSMNIIIEDLAEANEEPVQYSKRNDVPTSRSLSVSINGQPWYNLTPRQSAWGVLFGGEVDGDIDTEVDKIFGLDTVQRKDSPVSDDNCAARKPKRSKRSYSPKPLPQDSPNPAPIHFPKRTSTQPPVQLHPLHPSTSSSSSLMRQFQFPSSSSKSSSSSRLLSAPSVRTRIRTVSDFGSSNPHALVNEGRSRVGPRPLQTCLPTRLELRLDWQPTEEPSFIDMRDESLETESRTDSWQSLFEVACAA